MAIEDSNAFFRFVENKMIFAVEGKREYPFFPLTVDGQAFVPPLLIIEPAF